MSSTQPLVSIITVTFNIIDNNRAKTFQQCLRSVQNQTYANIEHIVIDGNSKDGTLQLLEKYKEKGWITYISEPDTGIYDAMNKGIKKARGKYIAFLNSDDYYHGKTGIEESVRALEKTGAAFSYAPVIIRDPKDNHIMYEHTHMHPKITNVYTLMPFCHQSMLTRKSVIETEGMFDTRYQSAGDYELTLRLCLKEYESVLIDTRFVTFRFGGMSDVHQALSVKEVAQCYYHNYRKLCKISKKECEQIYCQNYNGITLNLGWALRNNKYFDFEEFAYQKIRQLENTIAIKNHEIYLLSISKTEPPKYNGASITNSEFKLIGISRKLRHLIIPQGSLRKRMFDAMKNVA